MLGIKKFDRGRKLYCLASASGSDACRSFIILQWVQCRQICACFIPKRHIILITIIRTVERGKGKDICESDGDAEREGERKRERERERDRWRMKAAFNERAQLFPSVEVHCQAGDKACQHPQMENQERYGVLSINKKFFVLPQYCKYVFHHMQQVMTISKL